jgi:hypothetical protein
MTFNTMQLKNIVIFSFAGLYLLISTGMFVCLVHCSADYFLDVVHIAHHHEGNLPANWDKERSDGNDHHKGKDNHQKKEKCCSEGKDCSCCDKHPNYTVSENLVVKLDNQLPSVAILITHFVWQPDNFKKTTGFFCFWTEIHAPPAISGKLISILFRSLLI